jgi:hypothetical protein
MAFTAILLLATIMAVFGVLGYLKGSKWAFVALLILLVAFVVVEYRADAIVLALNGMYTGVMLVLKGGLGALASGDFEAVQEIYKQIEPLFSDQNQNLALLLVVFGAVGVGLLLSLVMKSKASVWGLIWGLIYGYILSAAALPLIISDPAAELPVPVLRPLERSAAPAAASQGPSAIDQLFSTLSQPENIQIVGVAIGVAIVLLLLLTVRSGVKSGAKKKG